MLPFGDGVSCRFYFCLFFRRPSLSNVLHFLFLSRSLWCDRDGDMEPIQHKLIQKILLKYQFNQKFTFSLRKQKNNSYFSAQTPAQADTFMDSELFEQIRAFEPEGLDDLDFYNNVAMK